MKIVINNMKLKGVLNMGLFDKFKKKSEPVKEKRNSEWQEIYERNKEKFRCKIDLESYFTEKKIGKMEVDILNIGEVNLPTGKIIACDPLVELGEAKTYLQKTPIGKFPVKIAVVLQYFLPGIPCVFYGTEIGMHGFKDPFNRKCFNWDENSWDKDLLNFYQEIGKFRKLYHGAGSNRPSFCDAPSIHTTVPASEGGWDDLCRQ